MKIFRKSRFLSLVLISSFLFLGILPANNQLMACEQETEGTDSGGINPLTVRPEGHGRPNLIMQEIGDPALLEGMGVCKAGAKMLLVLGGSISFGPATGLPSTSLDFVPVYSSQSTYSQGSMGYGLQHNFEVTLTDLIDVVTIKDEVGTLIDFAKDEYGNYVAERSYYSTLTKENGLFKWRKEHGTVYNFNSSNKLSNIVDRNGNKLQLNYDTNNKLSSVTDDSSRSLGFTYDAQGLIQTATDPSGRITQYFHDANGRLAKTKNPLNSEVNYYYDDPNDIYKITRVTDAREKTTQLAYDLTKNSVATITDPLNKQMSYNVNKEFWNTTVTDKNGIQKLYSYASGKITSETSSLGTVNYGYDENRNMSVLTDRNAHTQQWIYDTRGNITSYTNPLTKTWTATYESNFNKLTSVRDPLGNTTTQTVDPTNGNVSAITDALGRQTTFTYTPTTPTGKLKTVTDANLHTSTLDHDVYGNMTKYTDPLGNQTSFSYNLAGNILSIANANLYTTSFQYDALNRLVKTTYPDTAQTNLTYDANDNLTSVANALNKTTTYTYNDNNLLTSITDPLLHTTSYEYDPMNNLKKVTDANNKFITYDYDALYRPIKFTDSLLNITQFTYDGENLRSIIDAKTNTTAYQYDVADRLDIITYPGGSTEDYNFNDADRLRQKKDRKGQVINYFHNQINILIQKVYPDGSLIIYSYDDVGNLTSATNRDGTITSYAYDNADRLTTVTYPGNKIIAYTYDNAGNRTSMTDPDGNILYYNYDSQNRLVTIKNAANQELVRYTYDLISRRIKTQYLNGTYTDYSYDDADRLTSLVNRKADGSIISSFTYSYDNVGNRLTMTTTQGTHTYTYDDNYQLKIADYPVGFPVGDTTYNYDSVGNRTTIIKDSQTTTYTSNNLNQYTQVNSTTYTYDLNGCLTSDGTYTYSYDYDNRLTSASRTGLSATYSYDYQGRRVSKNVNGIVTKYIYDGDQSILETDSSGTTQARYIYGTEIDEPIIMMRNGNTYFYHFDGLGSVVNLTDSSGNVIESYSYDVYGQPNTTSLISNPYYFTSRYLDAETGLYCYRARHYSTLLGRFLQVDPLGYHDGMNLYSYVGNNSVNWADPYGLLWKTDYRRPIMGGHMIRAMKEYSPGVDPVSAKDMVETALDRMSGGLAGQLEGMQGQIDKITADKAISSKEYKQLKDMMKSQISTLENFVKDLKEKYPEKSWDKLKEASEMKLREEFNELIKKMVK